jgi:hypothetical protein
VAGCHGTVWDHATGPSHGKPIPDESIYEVDYIKGLGLSYSTSYSLVKFDKHRQLMPFPENTKGVILRIKGDGMPESTVLRVQWSYLTEAAVKPLIIQRVSAKELNRLQYVDLTLYQRNGELPPGSYEVKLEDEASAKSRRLPFTIL